LDNQDQNTRAEEANEKLNRALRRMSALREKGRLLERQYQDAKDREKNSSELVMELLERQRELNVMLNRANIMLNRAQEAMALTSSEFNEMAKALPEPKKVEWSDRISRVNELFKKTGFDEADVRTLDSGAAERFDNGSMRQETEAAFGKHEPASRSHEHREPPRIEAEPVETDDMPGGEELPGGSEGAEVIDVTEHAADRESRWRSIWQRIAG